MEKLLSLSLNLPLSYFFGLVGVMLFSYMSVWALAAIAKKRADLADIAWGPGFVLVAWICLVLGQATVEGVIVNILVTLWGMRLAFHLYIRNRKREEDFRYQTLKLRWGKNFNFRLFVEVFLLQGCILYVIALPIMWIHIHRLPGHILWLTSPLWLAGFALETIADLELALFKKDPSKAGKLLTTGVWGYVRHPNYLGELIQWWAIWLMAAFLPFGWALVISPLLLTFLIVHISGVKPLEEKFLQHAEFKEYLEKTPALIALAYPVIFLFWGVFLTLLIILNRHLIARFFCHWL